MAIAGDGYRRAQALCTPELFSETPSPRIEAARLLGANQGGDQFGPVALTSAWRSGRAETSRTACRCPSHSRHSKSGEGRSAARNSERVPQRWQMYSTSVGMGEPASYAGEPGGETLAISRR
jgi:hypothetical protein